MLYGFMALQKQHVTGGYHTHICIISAILQGREYKLIRKTFSGKWDIKIL